MAVGVGGGSASGYYNQSDVESAYTSVNEQTGIQAGAGGYDITVGGHTELTGAAIASTADPALNRLSTDSLAVSDLANHAEYDASSFGVSAGGGSSGNGWSGSASPSLGIRQSESESSTTASGISAGLLEIRSGDESALANLDREITELQHSGLGEIFDEQKVAERMEMGQVAGEVGFRAAGDIADAMRDHARGDLAVAMEAGDPAAIEAAQTRADTWAEGGGGRALLHGLTGAAVAALGGGDSLRGATGASANQLATGAMQDYLRNNGVDPHSPEGSSLMELASLTIGTVVGGESGAATALYGEQFNRRLHPDEIALIDELSKAFAKQLCGCEDVTGEQVRAASARLIREAVAQVDATANEHYGVEVDEAAQRFLHQNKREYDWGTAFYADDVAFADRMLFSRQLSEDPEAFQAMFNALVWSGLDEKAVKYGYEPELLAWADEEVGNRGAQLVSTWAGSGLLGGTAAAAPALIGGAAALKASAGAGGGWGAMGTGASFSGVMYSLGVGLEAHRESGTGGDFWEQYRKSFSGEKFAFSATVGALGGGATWQMLRWLGAPVGFIPSIKTAEGAVVRGNNAIQSAAVNRAGHAAIDHYSDRGENGHSGDETDGDHDG